MRARSSATRRLPRPRRRARRWWPRGARRRAWPGSSATSPVGEDPQGGGAASTGSGVAGEQPGRSCRPAAGRRALEVLDVVLRTAMSAGRLGRAGVVAEPQTRQRLVEREAAGRGGRPCRQDNRLPRACRAPPGRRWRRCGPIGLARWPALTLGRSEAARRRRRGPGRRVHRVAAAAAGRPSRSARPRAIASAPTPACSPRCGRVGPEPVRCGPGPDRRRPWAPIGDPVGVADGGDVGLGSALRRQNVARRATSAQATAQGRARCRWRVTLRPLGSRDRSSRRRLGHRRPGNAATAARRRRSGRWRRRVRCVEPRGSGGRGRRDWPAAPRRHRRGRASRGLRRPRRSAPPPGGPRPAVGRGARPVR